MLKYNNSKGLLNIKLSGELDHSSAPELREKLDMLIKSGGYEKIIFDFSELTFMDSTGVGLLMGRLKTARSLAKAAAIFNPPAPIDKVLKVSGIYSVIPKI